MPSLKNFELYLHLTITKATKAVDRQLCKSSLGFNQYMTELKRKASSFLMFWLSSPHCACEMIKCRHSKSLLFVKWMVISSTADEALHVFL